jgi:hypothetical protein
MRDINSVILSGTIFWSKLDDKQTYSTLRLGIKLATGGSCFAVVNNPLVKGHDMTKAGNKVTLNGYLDTWTKEDGTSELQIKCSGANADFYPKEKALSDYNHVVACGKILSYEGDSAVVEMTGERNPKTDKPTMRKAKVKIGDTFEFEIAGSKIFLMGKIGSTEVEGKSKIFVEGDYSKISIL